MGFMKVSKGNKMKIYKMNNHHFSTQKSFKIALESVLNEKSKLTTNYKFGQITSLMLNPKKVVYELKRATTKTGVLELGESEIELEIIEVEK